MRTNKEPYRSKNVKGSTYWREKSTGRVAYVWATWREKFSEYPHIGTVEFFFHYEDCDKPTFTYLTVNEFINQFDYIGDSIDSLT